MTFPEAVQEKMPSDNELQTGIVTGITPLVVNVRGGNITPGFLGSYSPVLGDNVQVLRERDTQLVLGISRDGTTGAPIYGAPARLVRYGRRETGSTPAAVNQSVLRVDSVPMAMGNRYLCAVPSVNMVATVANDRGNLTLTYSETGPAVIGGTVIQVANSNLLPASVAGSNMTIAGSVVAVTNTTLGSFLLITNRFAGAGNISLQGGATFPIEMFI